MRQIREWVSDSGKRAVRLHQREDHLFWFEEIYEDFDDHAGFFWTPGYQSGLFASGELAEAEIRSVTPWLQRHSDGS